MSKRSGVTLVEVLIAIFVTAIGLLALLVLFPVGALNMAQAIKDDRTAHCAANAKRLANFWDLRHDSSTGVFATTAVPPVPADPTPWTLGATPANSAFETPSMWGCNAQFITVAAGPSYPVFIDPAGYATFSTAPLGGSNSPIPRVMPRFLRDTNINPALAGGAASVNQQITRWMTMLDDFSFTPNGVPDTVAGTTTLVRENRYSYAFTCRVPDLSAPAPIPIELTVLVYNKRAVQTDVNGNPLGEVFYGDSVTGAPATGYTVSFPQTNVVTITWASGAAAPTVKPGSWIMDATYMTSLAGVTPASVTPPTGYCYRVINVSETYTVSNPVPGQAIDLELQNNRRAPTARAGSMQPHNAIILLDDVAEVFELGAQ